MRPPHGLQNDKKDVAAFATGQTRDWVRGVMRRYGSLGRESIDAASHVVERTKTPTLVAPAWCCSEFA
jgi:hypothetical protein